MPKIKPNELTADWSRYETRPIWDCVSSAELAKVLGVHLGTINNWKIRGILPEPCKHPRLNARKNWFQISKLKAWLEGRSEQEIQQDWIRKHFNADMELEQAKHIVSIAWKELGLERSILN